MLPREVSEATGNTPDDYRDYQPILQRRRIKFRLVKDTIAEEVYSFTDEV